MNKGSDSSFSYLKLKEFDNHHLVTFFNDSASGLYGYIVIHRGGLKRPAFGATRIWDYKSEKEALIDGLKLSKMMSYKSALAGLKYGGAKAVIISPKPSKLKKKTLLKSYSKFLNYLNGHFVTGADVGIDISDLNTMALSNNSIVGFEADAVKFTAIGVHAALKTCLEEVFDSSRVTGRTFAIQGVGKTGLGLLKLIYEDAKTIFISDPDTARLKQVEKQFPKVKIVKGNEIYSQKVDVFSPCALSNSINSKSITKLKCKIIVGSANSQLEQLHLGEKLHKLGILYAPDYLVNSGGLISVVDEYENKKTSDERILKKVNNIGITLKKLISESKTKNKPISFLADDMAKKISDQFV